MDVGFSVLDELLKDNNCGIVMDQFITPRTETIKICKTNNRSILGSMNDMINMTKFIFALENSKVKEITKLLNETPFSYLKYETPLSIIKEY